LAIFIGGSAAPAMNGTCALCEADAMGTMLFTVVIKDGVAYKFVETSMEFSICERHSILSLPIHLEKTVRPPKRLIITL